MSAYIKITAEGEFNCTCGNYPNAEGAYPCDRQGNYVEPTPDEWPDDLYRCDRCGIIFKCDSGEVIGIFNQASPERKAR